MEPIIDKLSEIETAASRIMESAVNETRIQDQKAEERTARFDAQVEAATQKKLENLKLSMEHSLTSMEHYFQEHHEQITDELYQKIIRM